MARFFGTDGIRDVAGEGRLSPDNVARAGIALARFAEARSPRTEVVRILLGRDPRPSGVELAADLARAMRSVGADVADAGVLPSPALAWLTAREGYDLGCAVSASHNPPEYNGIKPFAADARKLTDGEEHAIEALLADADPGGVGSAASDEHRVDEAAAGRYADATTAWLRPGGDLSGLHLVADLSAGAASVTAPAVLEALGAEVEILHPAGSRPINEACGSEHPEALLARVREVGADGGLAFDGDADRVKVADEEGTLLDGDDLLAILAADCRAGGGVPADAVVSTVMSNLGLEELLRGLDVSLERTAVGDRYVAERMRSLGAELGGEPSGHVVLPRADLDGPPALIGDGLVAGVRVLQAARRAKATLAELRARRTRHPQLLVNVRMAERRPLDDWPAFQQELAAQEEALAGEGRLVIRYSGTEPLLRIMAEGCDAEAVERAVRSLERVARED